jgi:hypothetical protein
MNVCVPLWLISSDASLGSPGRYSVDVDLVESKQAKGDQGESHEDGQTWS